MSAELAPEALDSAVAIVGMAGRFPGAPSVDALWELLCAGREGLRVPSDDELRASGVGPELLADPRLVRAAATLDDVELFDAELFGFSPREAELMDPQHRLALECAVEAFQDAGFDPARVPGLVGVYAGCGINTYLMRLLERQAAADFDGLQLTVGNDKDYLATRISYELDLRGPSVSVQSACSTSLVAVHLACQALLAYECDTALAGGASVRAPQTLAYRHVESSILARDGHCRPFDAAASGTLFGNGVGFVVLRRLADALASGEAIVALVRGTAINNDGSAKVGYTAPSIEGQAAVLRRALAAADVNADSIDYIEAHGTGTSLGDPIEVAALAQVFGPRRVPRLLGALKSNVGHLDAAAGIAGLIKTALCVHHALVPPTLHFERPNPRLDLVAAGFEIATRMQPWPEQGARPRRAGVSSFGIGGTNAHAVLEQAPARHAFPAAGRAWQVCVASARTPEGLELYTRRLRERVAQLEPELLPQVAATLQSGRPSHSWRRAWIARDRDELLALMDQAEHGQEAQAAPRVAFLFTGQGAQRPGMALDLHRREPAFREEFERALALVEPALATELRGLLLAPPERAAGLQDRLEQTLLAQPALALVEYALARLWISWGVRPELLLGHSVGEYVAACLADTLSLADMLALVCERGRLMQQQPPGAMMAVALDEGSLRAQLSAELSLAAVNGPGACVTAGPRAAVDALRARLDARGIACQFLATSHAFHSWQMEPVVAPLRQIVSGLSLRAPRVPIASTVTGSWLQPTEATSAAYWARQVCEPVRFADAVTRLVEREATLLLEIGPGHTLTPLAQALLPRDGRALALSSLRAQGPAASGGSQQALLLAVGRVWQHGVDIDWSALRGRAVSGRVSLPPVPFERRRCWALDGPTATPVGAPAARTEERAAVDEWAWTTTWRQVAATSRHSPPMGCMLVVGARPAWPTSLVAALDAPGCALDLVAVRPGERFARHADGRAFDVVPSSASDATRVLASLRDAGRQPEVVVHVGPGGGDVVGGFGSLLAWSQALAEWPRPATNALRLVALTTGLVEVTGDEPLDAGAAPQLGLLRVLSLEVPHLHCRAIDVAPGTHPEALMAELANPEPSADLIALRGRRVFAPVHERQALPARVGNAPFRERGVYVFTGGLGGLALGLSERLASACRARVALITRNPLPPRETWSACLDGDCDDELRRRLTGLQRIEAAGGELLVVPADVGDSQAVRVALEQIRAEWGALHGVFHLAGVPGAGLVQTKTLTGAADVLRPKIGGALALVEHLAGQSLDFMAFFSSLTALSGVAGQSDYCAANAFLDHLAPALRSRGVPAVALAWDAWEYDSWQPRLAQGLPAEWQRALREQRQRHGIRFDEGFEVLARALAGSHAHVIVSTRDLRATLAAHRTMHTGLLAGQLHAVDPQAPALGREQLEEHLAALWRELLGVAQVGPHDNFIDLGGHSLLAIQLVGRLRDRLAVDVPLRAIFEHPTPAGLAAHIAGQRPEPPQDDEIQRLLDEVQALSEEQALARLQALGEDNVDSVS